MKQTKNSNGFDQCYAYLMRYGARKGGDMVDAVVDFLGYDTFTQLLEAEVKKFCMHQQVMVAAAIYYSGDFDEEQKANIKLAYQEVA